MTDLILQKINKILDLGIPKVIVTVSIDGPKNIHDSIRGIKNSYSKAIETFAELNKLSKDRKNLNVFIALTLSPINIGNIKKTYQSIKRYVKIKPDDIHINLFHFSEHYYSNLGLKFKNYSKYENNLIKEIEKFKKMRNRNYTNNIKFITHSYLNFSKRFIENHKTPIRCKAINVSLFIDPFGNVFPCTIFNRKIGNIRNNNYSLKKILNYSFTKKVKEEIKKLDCPNCCSPCETNQMILSNILRHSSINF